MSVLVLPMPDSGCGEKPPAYHPPKARLPVEIVYDLVCPWCFLGVRRLVRTMRRRPDLLFDLTWRPFLLNPDMPRAGMARPDYIIRKFGGEDRARRLYSSISEIGRAEGVLFHFERIRRAPSSVDAHRLVRFARRHGQADAIVEALFSAHFTDGQDIGEAAVLVRIAQDCGLDGAAAEEFLTGAPPGENTWGVCIVLRKIPVTRG